MRNIPQTFLIGLSQWFDFQFPIPVIVRSVGSDFSYHRLKQGLGIMNNTFLDDHSDVAGSFNVFKRVATDHDKVGKLTDFDRTKPVVNAPNPRHEGKRASPDTGDDRQCL
jgi:hypothetical protein